MLADRAPPNAAFSLFQWLSGGVALPFAICRNKKPIGFLMIGYGLAEDDDLKDEDPGFVEQPQWYKGREGEEIPAILSL
ncbi:MAG: hypothetical protein II619_05155 [Bacilli bacterium]|nr:hypothetical protein [Bacilli bacterium]